MQARFNVVFISVFGANRKYHLKTDVMLPDKRVAILLSLERIYSTASV